MRKLFLASLLYKRGEQEESEQRIVVVDSAEISKEIESFYFPLHYQTDIDVARQKCQEWMVINRPYCELEGIYVHEAIDHLEFAEYNVLGRKDLVPLSEEHRAQAKVAKPAPIGDNLGISILPKTDTEAIIAIKNLIFKYGLAPDEVSLDREQANEWVKLYPEKSSSYWPY